MRLIKFDHSGFYLEENGRGLLSDPVEYGHQLPDFNNIDVIIVTHKHSDHLQPGVLAKIRQQNPAAKIFTTGDNLENIAGAIEARPGMHVQESVFDLEFFGSNEHAAIYNHEVPCENIGVVVNSTVVNPGDSFDCPNSSIDVLLVPISAPWLKTEESVKYIEALKPRIAINTHDGLLSEMGLTITNSWLASKAAGVGTTYQFLKPGEEIAL